MKEFGRALVVEPYWMTAVVAANAIALAGNGGLQAALLPSIADGTLVVSLAAPEPDGRYDFKHVATRIERTPAGPSLSGRKAVVLHAGQADKLIVSARASGDVASADGIALFVVDRDADGVRVVDAPTVDGLRSGEIVLERVVVRADAMLAAPGHGAGI